MRFCVDNQSDPEAVKEALTALRRTVRLGKRAEKALKAIREQGCFDGRVPVIARSYGRSYCVEVHRFPTYRPISRSDIPDWSSLGVDCGECEFGSYGGAKFRTVPIYLRGRALVLEENNDGIPTGRVATRLQRAKIFSARLGECRMKSNKSVTFSAEGSRRRVFRIRRNPFDTEVKQFAEVFAECLIKYDTGSWTRHRSSDPPLNIVPQHMLDLRSAVPGWLIEDGVVLRAFNDMLNAIEVAGVMSA